MVHRQRYSGRRVAVFKQKSISKVAVQCKEKLRPGLGECRSSMQRSSGQLNQVPKTGSISLRLPRVKPMLRLGSSKRELGSDGIVSAAKHAAENNEATRGGKPE